MAQHKIKDPKAIACITIALLGLSAAIVFFTIGGVFFAKENPKLLNYANDMCTVQSSSVRSYQCRTRYSHYTCYGAIWNVYHGENNTINAIVEEDQRSRSYSTALKRTQGYRIGTSYSCWYDTRRPSVAQWNKPSTVAAIILLCCGGVSVLLTGLFTFLSVKLVKQEILQQAHDNMDSYSSSNIFIKQ
ncbi:unnamed protein product [Rotaria socialis]|uniref:Uncharacterized protein n=1 Tax=Rotaria socialis TaxID=392032 RepID=A0A817WTN6_9BILA|nr:unnamed protein product [Rotaria socialis]CAF3468332.1 unnamed protein product [Rotaria socialis]CAF3488670.1 unnamed protein product [Rotaria socialis]CAF4402562.1 unnamed protein product [Rotaria socialis]CAF4513885.1 unnamed protein product [Rotaria socialis]